MNKAITPRVGEHEQPVKSIVHLSAGYHGAGCANTHYIRVRLGTPSGIQDLVQKYLDQLLAGIMNHVKLCIIPVNPQSHFSR